MATVTESSLLTAAHEIVDAFMDKTATLNDGVIKKASELGLNNDQTQRLIERTNTEAFLRVYPNDTDFEVASPEVVLGIKTASIVPTMNDKGGSIDDGLFKAANVQKDYFYKKASSRLPSRYATKVASVSDEDIFGMDEAFYKEAEATKYASAIDPEDMELCRTICGNTKTASQRAQEDLHREMAFSEAIDDLGDFIKQASLQGRQSIESSETELLNYFPENEALTRGIYDALVTKMACEGVSAATLKRSNGVSVHKYAHASELTNKFQKILNILK